MNDSTGCAGMLIALGILSFAGLCGGLLGAPLGADGAVAAACVLPTALLAGIAGWGVVSAPWVVARWLLPGLPELALARAVVGFVLATPATAVALAALVSSATADTPGWALGLPVAAGLVAVPFAVVTAVGARHALLAWLEIAAEAAEVAV